jgi:hypothetical protein
MLKVIRDLIKCKICKQILRKPVLLPCGETVCAEHEELFKNKYTAKCKLCSKTHKLCRSASFPVNKAVEGFLAGEISQLDFGDNYKNTTRLLGELTEASIYFDKLRKNPKDFIYERFQVMRRKVDLVREEIIKRVNDCSDKIMCDINSYEEECNLNLPYLESKLESNKMFDLSGIRGDLKEWEAKMNKLHFDEAMCKEIGEKSAQSIRTLENTIKELKNEIFTGKENKHDFEANYSNIFTTFQSHIGFNK